MPNFLAYDGLSAAEHQTRFDRLFAQGYSLVSLSVYGDPSNPSYAEVWVQRGGPGWQARHALTAEQDQASVNE